MRRWITARWRECTGEWLKIGWLAISTAITLLGSEVTAGRFERDEDTLILRNGEATLSVSLRSPQFLFSLKNTPVGGAAPDRVEGDLNAGESLRATYAPEILSNGVALEVVLHLEWSHAEDVLRKWAEYRLTGLDQPTQIQDVLLDSFDAAQLVATLLPAPPRSIPAFLDGFFAGVEFPIAATRIEKDRVMIGHKPFMEVAPETWEKTRTAVYGVAAESDVRRAFQRYIEFHRPEPKGLHFNYNSWWTSSVPFSQDDILALMKTFEENLFRAHGVGFDTFAIDLGWSNPNTIWDINRELFPEEFARIQEGAQRTGGHLGLWVSPSSFYTSGLNTQWAQEAGYETFTIPTDDYPWADKELRLLSLGGERYATAFRDRLASHVRRFAIHHVKLDGYFLGYDYMAGPYSAEQTAEGGIAAFKAMREANPKIWLECTFDAHASPWWLFHLNSVIGMFGDDSPHGRVPCPIYRESYTTGRDFYNLQGADRLMSPIAAQEILGLIHQSPEPFMNDAVVTILRGHAFLPMYINPRYMDPARWELLADTLHWARSNETLLVDRETLVLRPPSWPADEASPRLPHDAVMPREPYGYAHWDGATGLVMLRNPWIKAQTCSLVLGGNDVAAQDLVNVVSIYPEPRVYGGTVALGDQLDIALAPYETIVLSIAPDQPVADVPSVQQCIGNQITVNDVVHEAVHVKYTGETEPFGPDWTSLAGGTDEMKEISLQAQVTIKAPEARLLVLIEGANQKTPSASGSLLLNGVATPLRSNPSDAGFTATGNPPSETWLFLEADVTPGTHDIALTASLGAESRVASVWIWGGRPREEGDAYPNRLPEPEWVSLDAAALVEPMDVTDMTQQVERPREVERINGVYLDALEPVSVSQGWGELQRNQSVWERPLTMGSTRYLRGLGTHAEARIVYKLEEDYRHFKAWVGPDGANRGTVTFEVYVDGEKRWESGLMTREDEPCKVEVEIAGSRELILVVGDGDDGVAGDHANWTEAKLLR